MPKNCVLIDFEPQSNWTFVKTLEEETGEGWEIIKRVSWMYKNGRVENLRRYMSYFCLAFGVFVSREKYKNILSWQQFYGIFLGFFSRLFHVKKKNRIYVMTFIYKEKDGIIGKLYHWFVEYAISSKYIDRIICFSSTEPTYYSSIFRVDNSKFIYIPLGDDIDNSNIDFKNRTSILSIGTSNRDYGFLVDVFSELPYVLTIYSNKYEKIGKNIMMTGDRVGDKIADLLRTCKLMVIPLADSNISSGQLGALHAMQMGVPVIATDADGIKDFISSGENGYLLKNEKALWIEKIEYLLKNDDIWNHMSKKGIQLYNESHTVASMASNISKIIKNADKK